MPTFNTIHKYIKANVHIIKGEYKAKRIKQIDLDTNTINIFDSITDAANYMNVSISSISGALTGKCKSSCGYKWSYES